MNSIIRFYLQETGEGRIYGSRFVMRLSPKWNPEPDIMIVKPKNYNKVTKTRLEGPADLVIEILSKSTKEIDLNKKLPKYIESGVKEVWIIDPDEKSVKIINKDEEKYWKDARSEEILKSSVLEGLKLQVNWIWDREKYSSSTIIKSLIKTEL